MSLSEGRFTFTIQDALVTMAGEREIIRLRCLDTDGDEADVTIWLTEKAMGIARQSLKLCGFNVDTQSLSTLIDNPDLLKGRPIPVMVEEFKGKLRAQVALSGGTPPKSKIAQLDTQLRAAKKDGEVALEPEPTTAGFPDDEGIPF